MGSRRSRLRGAVAWIRRHLMAVGIIAAVVAISCFFIGFRHSQLACNLCAKRYGAVPDSFERYVIVGYDNKPFCPMPGAPDTPRIIKPGQPITIWVRAVYRDAVNKPVGGVSVDLSLVDAFGTDVKAAEPEFLLQPQTVRTDKDGFYYGAIVLIAQHQGHFRIKASYEDKNADARSYGGIILVQ